MKPWFKFFVLTLVVSNLLGLYFLGEENGRYFRAATMFIFLLLYLLKYYSGKILLLVFLLIFACDIFLIFYENVEFKALSYISRITAYLLLVSYIFPYLIKLKLNTFSVIVSVFILAINIYLIHIMSQSVPEVMRSDFFYPLFYLFGISLLILAAASISFHNRYASRQSFNLVIASFGLIFSDISFYIAYYLNFDLFFFVDRITNILGIAFLLGFSFYYHPVVSETDIS